jgi:electron transfer flavoprotein beta subunit
MNILVCVKQVLAAAVRVFPDAGSHWICSESDEYVMNRFDEFAVEAALLLRETMPTGRVDVISVGPERAEAVIRRAMGMGADNGIHVVTETHGYMDPAFTAALMAACVRNRDYDLILTGVMSEDDMNGQTGPMMAEMLCLPCATAVIHMEILGTSAVYVEREMEGGVRDALEVQLPALLSVQSGIHQPRYPSLSRMLRANRHPIEMIRAEFLDVPTSAVHVTRTAFPGKTRAGCILEGSASEKAARLLKILQARLLLR